MIKQDIKIGLNRLLKFKAYSLINISGLAIAIASTLVIFLYVSHHLSFDKYISDGENSYRIITRVGDGTYNTNTFASFRNYLGDCPEVKSFTACYYNYKIEDVLINDKSIKVNSAIFVDDSFIEYFSLDVIEGDEKSINKPNTVMLTPEMAQKLFPNKYAIGETVFLRSFTPNQDSLISYTVSGIIKSLPKTSHIQFDMLLSKEGHFSPTVEILDSRKVFGGLIYVKLHPSTNVKDFEDKLIMLTEPTLGNVQGPPLDGINHKLQNVNDIHFTQGLVNETETTVRRSFINILILVGILIIILATINFVVMSIARQSFYQKTTFIIRFFGGNKFNLLSQINYETLITTSMSFIISFVIVAIVEGYFAETFFINNNISLQNPTFWLISIALFISINIIVLILSSINLINPNYSLKPIFQAKKVKAAIILVIFQFSIVITLIGFATSVNLQMNYINEKDLGYSKHNVLIIKVPQFNEKVYLLKQELEQIPGIISSGTAHHYPGYHLQDVNIPFGSYDYSFTFGFIDYDAIETLGIKPLKYFTSLEDTATNVWMINETFYNNLKVHFTDEQIASGNFSEDIMQEATDPNQLFNVNGVMQDFHYASLHSKIENFAFKIAKPEDRYNRFVLARLEQNKASELLDIIEHKLEEIYPGQPISYSFLDEELNKEYVSEQTLLKLINVFSILSILIACFGLIGLTIFITEKRTKEIGMRRINGASVGEIIKLLNLGFVKWLGVSFIIATPVTYYILSEWMKSFAYRITLSWWIFVLAGVIATIITLVTVSWQTYKAATQNPINSLRDE